MTVAELEHRMSSAELAEWAAYFKIVNEERDKAMKEGSK